jgi:hypothetical protein
MQIKRPSGGLVTLPNVEAQARDDLGTINRHPFGRRQQRHGAPTEPTDFVSGTPKAGRWWLVVRNGRGGSPVVRARCKYGPVV